MAEELMAEQMEKLKFDHPGLMGIDKYLDKLTELLFSNEMIEGTILENWPELEEEED